MRYEFYEYWGEENLNKLFILVDNETSDNENFRAITYNSIQGVVQKSQDNFNRFENYFPDLLCEASFLSKHKTLEEFKEYYIEYAI